jgi:type II secretory pathway component PulF
MGVTASDIAEFYYQLALLVRAKLPLPASLLKLSAYFPKSTFRDAVIRIGERAERGESFTDILADFPEFFPAFHVKLLTLGERSGTLPEMLSTVARFARLQQAMVANLRSVLAYPLLTIHVSLIGFMVIGILVLPKLAAMLRELGGDLAYDGNFPLPWVTHLVFAVADWMARFSPLVGVLYGLFLVYTLWLFLPGRASHRAALWLTNLLPGSWRVSHSLESARICAMWGTFLERNVPMPDALALVAELVDRPAPHQALLRVEGAARAGEDVAEALLREPALNRLIGLTLQHSPEDRLPGDLQGLSELLEHRVALAAQAAVALWTAAAFVIMVTMVTAVGLALYLPLTLIFRSLTTWMM